MFFSQAPGRASVAVTPGAAFYSLYRVFARPVTSVARFLRVPHLVRISCDRIFFVLPGCSCCPCTRPASAS
jgi:hypothetical protein